MNFAPRLKFPAWLIALLAAGAFLLWTGYERARRVEQVTRTDSGDAVVDPASPTGYADGKRWLIVPERNSRSYQWILQTQQMFEDGEWRVRHVDYDNAPDGREVHAASLYRWWLAAIAWCDHVLSARPLGLSVERAALWSEPLLHLLLLVATTLFLARYFGNLPATLGALGLATIFPFAAGFLPGVPDDHSLSRIFALGSILPLLAVLVDRAPASDNPSARARRLFALAGFAGGLGLWVSARQQAPLMIGIALGTVLALWIRSLHRQPTKLPSRLPWRTWAWVGALTSVAGYLIEYFPAHLGYRLEVNHPLYALAWIGVGEALTQIDGWFRHGKGFWNLRQGGILAAAVAAVAALPVSMHLRDMASPWAGDLLASRLTFLPNRVVAADFSTWIERDGLSGPLAATIAPLVIIAIAVWLLVERRAKPTVRAAVALALGPVALALFFAFHELSWWAMTDATLLALAVSGAIALPLLLPARGMRAVWMVLTALFLAPGVWQLRPLRSGGDELAFTQLEVMALIERSLAHWIADHAGPDGGVILVPPDRTINLCFHGGLRGLGSSAWENRDGLAATTRIVVAANADEALDRLNAHGVTHIVLPSWDTDLYEFARRMLANPQDAFIIGLNHWAMPIWLHPLPYRLPANVGFDDQSVTIFEVTDDSNRPAAVARLAEYFLELGQKDSAAAMVPALQEFPTDLGALVALAQIERTLGNTGGFNTALSTILASLNAGTDRFLAWDRRVSLAALLALGEHHDRAREQVERCLRQLDATGIRSLTTGSLFRLLNLARAYNLPFGDSDDQALARKLLPAELRNRL